MWIHVYIARYPHLEGIQHIPLFAFDAQAMWIHVYIAMYPHSKDTLIYYVLAKMWIHVYIARYPHLEDKQHIPLFVFDAQVMWIHVYIAMYPHSKDILL